MSNLTITPEQETWTPDQLAALPAVIAGGRPDAAQLAQFFHLCKSKGLDPFQRDIYMIFRGGKPSFQVGIEGLRKIANRWAAEQGYLLGSKAPVFFGADGSALPFPNGEVVAIQWTITVDGPNGLSSERTAVVTMAEYKQNGGLWKSKPNVMLAKVAESVALRQAAPEATSGVYTHDEMPDHKAGGNSAGYRQPPAKPANVKDAVPGEDPFVRDSSIPEGHVAVAQAKIALVSMFTEAGLETDAARNMAKATWDSLGFETKETISIDDMAALNEAASSLLTEED